MKHLRLAMVLFAAGLASWTVPAPLLAAASGKDSVFGGGDAARGQQIFASHGCGWCHEHSGRQAGRGPQLMNTARSDQFIAHRIANGQPGRMPAFGQSISFENIKDLIAFIHSLKPEGSK